jgi:transposase
MEIKRVVAIITPPFGQEKRAANGNSEPPPQKLDQKSNDWEVGFFMAKYSFEFKKKIVEDYLDGKGGIRYLAHKYNAPAQSNVQKWINNYQVFGDEGLMRSRKQIKYSFQYKLHVVELYLTNEVSYQELALQEKINNPTQIVK